MLEASQDGRRVRHATGGSGLLRALGACLRELEGDGSLGRRIRAAQELAELLVEVPEDDMGVSKLFQARGVPSLLMALISVCGEDHALTRNCILASLATLARVLPGEQLQSDTRVWALLMRMVYQRDETSVLYALTALLHLTRSAECASRVVESRRLCSHLQRLEASPNAEVAATATALAERVDKAQEDSTAAATPAVEPAAMVARGGEGRGGRGRDRSRSPKQARAQTRPHPAIPSCHSPPG